MVQGTGEHPWIDADAMEQQIESMVESAVSYPSACFSWCPRQFRVAFSPL